MFELTEHVRHSLLAFYFYPPRALPAERGKGGRRDEAGGARGGRVEANVGVGVGGWGMALRLGRTGGDDVWEAGEHMQGVGRRRGRGVARGGRVLVWV